MIVRADAAEARARHSQDQTLIAYLKRTIEKLKRDRYGQHAAMIYSLIVTAKMNDVDPQAWLAGALARINDISVARLDERKPGNWLGTCAKIIA